MEELLRTIARSLVEDPESVEINRVEDDQHIVLELRVAENDKGRIIGKQGRIAKAIRCLISSATAREAKKVTVDII